MTHSGSIAAISGWSAVLFGTFDLGLHAWEEPIQVLTQGAARDGIHLVTPRLGAAIEPSRVERIDPWWLEALEAHPATLPRTRETSVREPSEGAV